MLKSYHLVETKCLHIFFGCQEYFTQPYILKCLKILRGHFEWRQWVLGIGYSSVKVTQIQQLYSHQKDDKASEKFVREECLVSSCIKRVLFIQTCRSKLENYAPEILIFLSN